MAPTTKLKIVEGIQPGETVVAEKEGDFNSKVQVGDRVEKGSLIGEIRLGNHYTYLEVVSPCRGTIIKIYEEREISKGDEIAIIRK